jgi:hypothetical protein
MLLPVISHTKKELGPESTFEKEKKQMVTLKSMTEC